MVKIYVYTKKDSKHIASFDQTILKLRDDLI